MALFGTIRDVTMFKGVATELVHDIITQQIGYYKVMLGDTVPNVYGEALTKNYIGPVLLNCLIERGDYTVDNSDFGPDVRREVTFRFLKDDLIAANVVPEVGDIVMYNELYYESDNVNENQLIMGKDPNYSYSAGLQNFGGSFSIIVKAHMTTPERLGIEKFRL
jgi:hypothetical protein